MTEHRSILGILLTEIIAEKVKGKKENRKQFVLFFVRFLINKLTGHYIESDDFKDKY